MRIARRSSGETANRPISTSAVRDASIRSDRLTLPFPLRVSRIFRIGAIAEGLPEMRVAILPRAEVIFDDGWYVQGLKATGSYDYHVQDVFVPAVRTFPLFTTEPLRGASPAFRMGMMPVTAAGHAAWALGVAKSMLDDVEELAATKYRMSDMASLASRPTFQKGLAHHVAAWRAAMFG